jgi:putative ATPase
LLSGRAFFMDLFSTNTINSDSADASLAFRMRPRKLSELDGQESLLGEGKLLRRLVASDRIHSAIFFGPPGTGKTSLVQIIGSITKSHFTPLSAVESNVSRLKEVIAGARNRRANSGMPTMLFVDEFHRFNRAQQEVLLPHIENGTISFIGLTTSNPFHSMAPALISRSHLFRFQPLGASAVERIIRRALTDRERGLGGYDATVSDQAIEFLVRWAEGDARRALNTLELAVITTPPDPAGGITITPEIMAQAAQKKFVSYDRNGDEHYNTISAFIKSIRGSDPDAALYWLAKMIRGGEDQRFLARRLVILASEDIGNADPNALVIAMNTARAVEYLGMPEGGLVMAQAVTYLSTAPKSNASYLGLKEALRDVEEKPLQPIPAHLKNTSSAKETEGSAKDHYLYPHDYPGGWVEQRYTKESKKYYRPTSRGYEAVIQKRMAELRSEADKEL